MDDEIGLEELKRPRLHVEVALPAEPRPGRLARLSTSRISRYTARVRAQRHSLQARWNRVEEAIYSKVLVILRQTPLPPSKDGRQVPIGPIGGAGGTSRPLPDERRGGPYVDNLITSARYSIYSFLPKQLLAQFRKLANFYFLCVSILQMIPTWSTTGNYTTIVPLMIFLSISMGKEGYDDWRRSVSDKEENNRLCKILTSGASAREPVETKWKDIQVGDVILLENNDWVPADIVLLSSHGRNQVCYVETMALDGETNLKSKSAIPDIYKHCSTLEQLHTFTGLAIVEDPNTDLYKFDGRFIIKGITVSLSNSQILYRGSIIRNTPSMYGLVIFTGEESKIRMNANKHPRTKAPHLQGSVNRIVILIVIFVLSLAAVCTIAYSFWRHFETRAWYIRSATVPYAPILASFIILYNTLIPLSLYVSMEIVKLCQMFLMQWDIDMYDEASNTPMVAHTSTINEELGQITHMFTDKTGTLTDNVMLFRKLSIGGHAWLHDLDVQRDAVDQSRKLFMKHKKRKSKRKGAVPMGRVSMGAPPRTAIEAARWISSAEPEKAQPIYTTVDLTNYLRSHPHTLYSRRLRFFLLALGLCHTCLPEQSENGEITYQSASPDELALIDAAAELGFRVVDRQPESMTVRMRAEGGDNSEQLRTFEILDVIEFSSKRKRMSIIIRLPDGKVCLFCKGADSVIIERLLHADLARRKANQVQMANERRMSVVGEHYMAARESTSSMLRSRSIARQKDVASAIAERDLDSWLKQRVLSAAGFDLSDSEPSSRQSAQFDARHSLAMGEALSPLERDTQDDIIDEGVLDNEGLLFERTFTHLQDFATEGLRTLLYSFRILDEDEYQSWHERYAKANSSLADRQEKVEAVAEEIEQKLELCGATAIEDKLQEGVPDAIDKLRRANIKLWMLTGDKRETAINIGHSCRLIKTFSTVTILDRQRPGIELAEIMGQKMVEIESEHVAHSVIVVDGATLAMISADEVLMAMFVDLGVKADSVIVCRASPSQKSLMVNKVRTGVKGAVTLAIGDGANDIAMIQEAHVGIGITGREGLQAARSSDYSIAQFRYLLKLLLVHGRWNYVRICKYVLGTFYKEVIFYLGQAIFQIWCGWTGTSLYEPWSISMFNTLFTSLPVIFLGIFEKDLTASTLLAVPELYAKGQRSQAFNIKIYCGWMFVASVQSVLIFYFMWLSYGIAFQRDPGVLALGNIVYTAVVVVICIKLNVIELHNKSLVVVISLVLSIGGWFLWNLILSQIYRDNVLYDVKGGISARFGRQVLWWATIGLSILTAIVFDLYLQCFRAAILPSDSDIFQAIEKDPILRRRLEEEASPLLQQSWNHGKKKASVECVDEREVEEILSNRAEQIQSVTGSSSSFAAFGADIENGSNFRKVDWNRL